MKVKELIGRLQGVDEEHEVIIATPRNKDDEIQYWSVDEMLDTGFEPSEVIVLHPKEMVSG